MNIVYFIAGFTLCAFMGFCAAKYFEIMKNERNGKDK